MALVLWRSSKELSQVFQIYCHVSTGFISQLCLHLLSCFASGIVMWQFECTNAFSLTKTTEKFWLISRQPHFQSSGRAAMPHSGRMALHESAWPILPVVTRDPRVPVAMRHCSRWAGASVSKWPRIKNHQSRLCRSHSVAHAVANHQSQNGGEEVGSACCFGTSPIDSSVKAPQGAGRFGNAAVCYSE